MRGLTGRKLVLASTHRRSSHVTHGLDLGSLHQYVSVYCHSHRRLHLPAFHRHRLTDGGKVVSHTHRPLSSRQEHYFLLLVLISVRGLVNPRV
jgi:hypothetical protein